MLFNSGRQVETHPQGGELVAAGLEQRVHDKVATLAMDQPRHTGYLGLPIPIEGASQVAGRGAGIAATLIDIAA